MKRIFTIIALCALSVIGFSSCNEIEEIQPSNGARRVTFQAQLAEETKTALEIRIVPDWRNTPTSMIHLFETYNNGTPVEGTDVLLETKDDNMSALITASFESDISIIVNPPVEQIRTKAAGSYDYNAVIAKKVGSKFVIPELQIPEEISSFDPNADFIIGKRITVSESYDSKPVRLKFNRPVALSRLALYNIPGDRSEVIREVKIVAEDPMTGSVEYSGIDFEEGKLTNGFDTSNGSNTITMSYPDGLPQHGEVLYAYFISVPGTIRVKDIIVTTDKATYTKSRETGASMKFDNLEFKNIAVNMTTATRTAIGKMTQNIEWQKPEQNVITEDEYDLNSEASYESPIVYGCHTNLSYSSSNEQVATISSTGVITPLAVGETVIKAMTTGDDEYEADQTEFTLTVVKITPPTVLNRVEQVEDGGMYVIVNNGTALQNNNGAFGAVEATVADDHSTVSISGDVDLMSLVWEWKSSDLSSDYGDYTIANNGSYLQVSGTYPNYTVQIGAMPTGDNKKYVVWEYGSGNNPPQVMNGNNSHRYLTYNDSWTVPTSASSHGTYLFEYVDPREAQTLSFATEEAELDLAESTTYKQAVSGAETTVTYASSDEEVATVADDGTVTGLKRGVVTITATAAESDAYQEGEASYQLTIINSDLVKTFVKVERELEDYSGTYLLVDESASVAFASAETNYKVAVDIANKAIKAEEAFEMIISKSSAGEGKYDVKTFDNRYLYRFGDDILFNTNISNNRQYYAMFSFAGNGNFSANFQRSGGSDNYFQYSNGAFGFGTSSSATFQLYRLDDGTEPVYVKEDRGASFVGGESVSKVVGDEPFKIQFNGKVYSDDTVTFSSDNTAVATVADDGTVTIKAAGTANISVSVAATDEYKAWSGTLKVTVTEPAVTKTYIKVERELEDWSGTYLFVEESANVALAYNVSDNFKTAVTIANKQIVSSELEAIEITVSPSSLGDGKYDVKTSNNKYIYWYSNAFINNSNIPSNANQYYCSFSGNGDVSMSSTRTGSGTPSVNYITYDGTKFTFNTTNTNTIQLYRLDDGTTPVDPPTPPATTSYYTKVTTDLPATGSWDKVLFVYDNGDGTGYAFKGIYSGDVSNAPNGTTETNTSYLTTEGNAVAVTITSDGIVSSTDVDACTLTMEFDSQSKHYLKMNAINGYFRMLSGSNGGKFVVMSSRGYRLTYSRGSETNNFSAKRDSYYFGFNGTNFAGSTSTSNKFSIYKLSE